MLTQWGGFLATAKDQYNVNIAFNSLASLWLKDNLTKVDEVVLLVSP